MLGLIVFGLAEGPVAKSDDACDQGDSLRGDFVDTYGIKLVLTEGEKEAIGNDGVVYKTYIGGYPDPFDGDHLRQDIYPAYNLKDRFDFLTVAIDKHCNGVEDCPAIGVYHGDYFEFDFLNTRPDWAVLIPESEGGYKTSDYKGYCYVFKGYDEFQDYGPVLMSEFGVPSGANVDPMYAAQRFNLTLVEMGDGGSGYVNPDWFYYGWYIDGYVESFPFGWTTETWKYDKTYNEFVAYGCSDSVSGPTEFNVSARYGWSTGTPPVGVNHYRMADRSKTYWPPSAEHKCKKGGMSFYYKYDKDDQEHYRFEQSLTDFWGTIKKTIEERNGIRTFKVKVGLSNKLSVVAGIGISVAASAVIVAIGCIIFYFACKGKTRSGGADLVGSGG